MSFNSDPALQANQLPISISLPGLDEPELFREQLELLLKRISDAVNTKEGGLYQTVETAAFQSYFTTYLASTFENNRPVYRMVVDFGTLPNAGTTSVAHGIAFDSTYTITRMYGAATDPSGLDYLPLPYSSTTLVNNIELNADATNVNVTTGIDRTAFTRTSVVVEYTKIDP